MIIKIDNVLNNKPRNLTQDVLMALDDELEGINIESLNDNTSWQIKKQLLKELDYRLGDFWKFMATPLYDQIKRGILDK